MLLRIGLLLILSLSITSCSSYWKRKKCEKVDWFQRAHSVAMSGKRLDEDPRYAECKKVDAEINAAILDRGFKSGMGNYCKPSTALDKGAKGISFNYDFCESNDVPKLKAQHKEGNRRFCQPKNGYVIGSKGLVYNNQCSKTKEKAFLPRYKKGRQVFLKNEIAKSKGQIHGLNREISEKKLLRNQLNMRLYAIPKVIVVNKERTYDPVTKTYKESSSANESDESRRQREDLEWQIRSVTREIDTRIKKQNTVRDNIHKLRSELEGLRGS